MKSTGGLRERKKQQTREALSLAALRLCVERGLENVRVEDIAAEVNVSPRTFANYFPSKYAAIAGRQVDRVARAADALRERPASESLWEAVVRAVPPLYGEEDGAPSREWLDGVRKLLGHPAVHGALLHGTAEAERSLAVVVAERTRTEPDDLYPQIVAAAIQTATRSAVLEWLDASPARPLQLVIRDTLAELPRILRSPPWALEKPALIFLDGESRPRD